MIGKGFVVWIHVYPVDLVLVVMPNELLVGELRVLYFPFNGSDTVVIVIIEVLLFALVIHSYFFVSVICHFLPLILSFIFFNYLSFTELVFLFCFWLN